MIKKLLAILAAGILLIGATPVMAADGKGVGLKVGDKLVISKDTTAEVLSIKGTNSTYKMTIGEAFYLDDLATPLDCRWIYDAENKQYIAGANYFEATVKEGKVTVTYNGKSINWKPTVTIGTTNSVKSISISPSLINPITGKFEDPINENYFGNTLYWRYDNGIVRSLRIIEGVITEYFTLYEPIKEDITIISNETKDIGFDYSRPQTAWDNTGRVLTLDASKDKTLDKTLVLTAKELENAEYPVVIDPDVSFTTSAYDGHFNINGQNYTAVRGGTSADLDKTGTTLWVGQTYAPALYYIRRCVLYFDTSAIPDGVTITSAILKLYGSTDYSSTDVDIVIQNGMPTYPSEPPVYTDYNQSYYTGDGGSWNTSEYTAGYNEIELNATGRGWINVSGTTKFMLRSSKDISSTAPTGAEWVTFYSYEKGAGYRPVLEISYSASEPSITTDAASDIAQTTARLNSTITDDGGDDCEVRWGYGTTTQASIEAYDTYTAWGGSYTTGNKPYLDIEDLTGGETYYFRVEARNSDEDALGSERSFTTESSVANVTNFRAYPQATFVNLSWAKGTGATNTVIRYSYETYPTLITEGIALYSGTAVNYKHEGITTGVTIFYSAWGESGGEYSAGYATAVTTTSAFELGGDSLDAPIVPANWQSEPDATGLANIPVFYDAVNDAADAAGMPQSTLWLILCLVVSVAIGIGVYIKYASMFAGLIVITVCLGIGTLLGIMPFWIPVISLIITLGMNFIRREIPA